jgi:hypothetical protein
MREPARHSNYPPNAPALRAEVRRLQDAASGAIVKQRYAEALQCCLQLEALQPSEPAWARRAAYCCHRLGRRAEERAALLRAAEGYERGGFVRKASAMYRLVLALEPADQQMQQRLSELDAGRAKGLERLQGPAVLRYMTPSEIPLPPAGDEAAAHESALSSLRAPRTPAVDSSDAEPIDTLSPIEAMLVDEYEVLEFTETEVRSK